LAAWENKFFLKAGLASDWLKRKGRKKEEGRSGGTKIIDKNIIFVI
jgi:hypothetical protein